MTCKRLGKSPCVRISDLLRELAGPGAEERSGVMTAAALGEVVHHQGHRIELRGAVAPKVSLACPKPGLSVSVRPRPSSARS